MNEWISVNERLPKQGVDVLFYIPSAKQIDIGWLDDGSNGELCFVGTVYGCDLSDVSHWQPLPEPPMDIEETMKV